MLFEKCPVCSEFAFVQPDGVFKCENGHIFKINKQEKTNDDEIWEHMPEWVRILKEAVNKKFNN